MRDSDTTHIHLGTVLLVVSALQVGCSVDREVAVPTNETLNSTGAAGENAGTSSSMVDSIVPAGGDAGPLRDGGIRPSGLTSCQRFRAVDQACPQLCNSCANGLCRIECDQTGDCSQVTLDCPEGWSCFINCSGRTSCANSIFLCAENAPCEVSCAGPSSCSSLVLDCGRDACKMVCSGGSGENSSATRTSRSCRADIQC